MTLELLIIGVIVSVTGGVALYKIEKKSLSRILEEKDPVNLVISLGDYLKNVVKKRGFESLTEAEKTTYLLRDFYISVAESFIEYFYAEENNLNRVHEALRTIKAHQTASLLKKALAFFDGTRPIEDLRERGKAMKRWDEDENIKNEISKLNEELYKDPDDFFALLSEFIWLNKGEFVSTPKRI